MGTGRVCAAASSRATQHPVCTSSLHQTMTSYQVFQQTSFWVRGLWLEGSEAGDGTLSGQPIKLSNSRLHEAVLSCLAGGVGGAMWQIWTSSWKEADTYHLHSIVLLQGSHGHGTSCPSRGSWWSRFFPWASSSCQIWSIQEASPHWGIPWTCTFPKTAYSPLPWTSLRLISKTCPRMWISRSLQRP